MLFDIKKVNGLNTVCCHGKNQTSANQVFKILKRVTFEYKVYHTIFIKRKRFKVPLYLINIHKRFYGLKKKLLNLAQRENKTDFNVKQYT